METSTSELTRRIITGGLGAVVLIALIVYGGWIGITLITAVISIGMILEFANITFSLLDRPEKRLVLVILTWLVEVSNLIFPKTESGILVFCFLCLFTYFLFTASRFDGYDYTTHLKELMYSVFGLLYLVFIPLDLTLIHGASHGVQWTLLFFLIVWSSDTGAYFVGKKYGKRKLYPKISPKKTVEGAMAGLGSGLLIAVLFKLLFFRELGWLGGILTAVLVGVAGQVGDLCESFLKRAFDKKDSGTILPGHGGFLDRFDGVVFSLPVMYTCVRILGGG